MRIKEFFIRTGFLIPIAFWTVVVFMILFGMITNALGATSAFYCTVYCKLGAALIGTVVVAVIYCQARACWKD